ncbi:hypothetical protein QUA42_24240 [Microcoleus sp. Pol11C2]
MTDRNRQWPTNNGPANSQLSNPNSQQSTVNSQPFSLASCQLSTVN